MLRILYVTGLWSGLADVLLDGKPPCGMPAFFRPLRALIEAGHHVDLLVYSPRGGELNLGVEWLKPEQIELLHAPATSGVRGLWQLDVLYAHTLKRIKQQDYDFIYGQGTMGTLGVIAARRRRVPCGQRLYGISYFIREFTDGLLDWIQQARAFIRHPLHYKAFSLPKDFLLVTNDGTRADHVFSRIGNPHTKFLFWHNGVD